VLYSYVILRDITGVLVPSQSHQDRLEQHLPLKPQWFHILLALSRDTLHGSGIVRSVLSETRGKVHLWPATLYGSLDDLDELGWIEEVSDPAERPKGESEKKRFFRITLPGARVLAADAERMRALATTALARLGA
jgi:DNA-binding PadR family transcriptional regulator